MSELSKLLDSTVLKPETTAQQIKDLCAEAKELATKSVCISPIRVKLAAEELAGSDVLVCTVVGFPHGASTSAVKAFEAVDAVENGAHEVDMVISVGKAHEGDYDYIEGDVRAVREAIDSHSTGIVLKVILETTALSDEQILEAGKAAIRGGADFLKTSTGFHTGGATEHTVELLASVAEGRGVKASGGVRSAEDVAKMVAKGATRIGTSSAKVIVEGGTSTSNY